MPHYRSGKLANLGDVVRGLGYNVKHEIVGVVVGITPGAESCNIQVQHAAPVFLNRLFLKTELSTEYGQADAFEKVA